MALKFLQKKTKGQFCLKKGCYTVQKMGQNLHLPRGAATNYASWWRVCMYYERENWSQAGSKRVQWLNTGILQKITKNDKNSKKNPRCLQSIVQSCFSL